MKTQMDWVITQLNKKGYVTRNQALRRYISRLGALIQFLKDDGWKFNAYYKKNKQGKDYIYELIK